MPLEDKDIPDIDGGWLYVVTFKRDLEDYLNAIEDFLQKQIELRASKINQLEERNDKMKELTNEQEIEDYYLHIESLSSEIGYYLDTVYPRILRNSFLVTCYSYLEKLLNYLCDALRNKKDIPIKVNDLRGGVLDRSKVYLTKLVNKEIPTNIWEEMLNISTIRNCIVHNEGRINTGNERRDRNIKEYIDQREDITYDSNDIIELTKEYCNHVLDEIWILFENLYSENR